MDSSIIYRFLIVLFIFTTSQVNAIEFQGKFIQGHFILGKTNPEAKILVGKKVGEGVFGVSFKIKGPPKDLKTNVNPIKTLTPRFITRTLEKIKKN